MAQMNFIDKVLGRKDKEPDKAELNLNYLLGQFGREIPKLMAQKVDPFIVRARMADGYRSIDRAPVDPSLFDLMTEDFDDEDWKRLALAVSAFNEPGFAMALSLRADEFFIEDQVVHGFLELAQTHSVLTLELFNESVLRLEEYARHVMKAFGIAITGESEAVSEDKLYRIDYARLLKEAEDAQLSAQQRIEYIRKLQEEEEKKRPRRGKW
jgi:hypothetical protein